VKEFYAALLVAETAMIGLFAASNLFLFFVFWELILIPVFLLIGVWGGPGRVYASVKFLIFTLAGSVLMLVAIIVVYRACGSFDFGQSADGASAYMAAERPHGSSHGWKRDPGGNPA
jgi:NADH-quinone oxidoreductase subunit M